MIAVVRIIDMGIAIGENKPGIEIFLDVWGGPTSASAKVNVSIVGYVVAEDIMDCFGD